ncbi:MAG TPA: hypothetical protein VNQ90_15510 [Chthoniobacteraceae bacterium]|nr:hypothetical protein [Chthoniobacteraceae bacterium]
MRIALFEHEADATLFASAPEMLEALKALVGCIEETDVDGMTCHAEPMTTAFDAIAKAEGKEGN